VLIHLIFLQDSATPFIVTGILSGVILILLLGVLVISFVLEYQKRRKQHMHEMQLATIRLEQQLLQSQLEIQEQTFNAISSEIHDNVGQILSLSKVQLSIVESEMEVIPALLTESKENITRAMNDLRDIAKSLSADRIEQINLNQSIEHEVERLNRTRSVQAQLQINGNAVLLTTQKKLILLRLTQEALNNVVKHAQAQSVLIQLDYRAAEMEVTVKDNGVGFIQSKDSNSGLGLQNIQKRTSLIGGHAVIESTPGAGTTIRLNIPYE